VQRLHPVSLVIHSPCGVRWLQSVSRAASVRAGDYRDPGGQAGEMMPQRREVGFGEVVADQAQVQVPALRAAVGSLYPGRHDARVTAR
jgi:hypothetical protein